MSMHSDEKTTILEAAKNWFKETIAHNHTKNTRKLIDPGAFTINPFLVSYLANFLTGNSEPLSIARALIYPRVLGTSINTSFGQNSQKFTSAVLKALGSTTQGIDIEFIDHVDGKKKYCQLKAGPNTINKDDVTTIRNHFSGLRNLARANNLKIDSNDLIVGVLYGEVEELSGHYMSIQNKDHYPVHIGQDFWHRITGDENFYFDLVKELASVASAFDGRELLEKTVQELAASDIIQRLSGKS